MQAFIYFNEQWNVNWKTVGHMKMQQWTDERSLSLFWEQLKTITTGTPISSLFVSSHAQISRPTFLYCATCFFFFCVALNTTLRAVVIISSVRVYSTLNGSDCSALKQYNDDDWTISKQFSSTTAAVFRKRVRNARRWRDSRSRHRKRVFVDDDLFSDCRIVVVIKVCTQGLCRTRRGAWGV